MSISKAIFSSTHQDWGTPQYLFNFLNKRFGFELDPCANDYNHKCDTYFTEQENGLEREWTFVESAFVNSPYNREVAKWIKKSYHEAKRGMVVVCLIAARTDTKWWHEYCMKATEIWLVKGRLHFTKQNGAVSQTSPAPFPSAVIVFDGLRGTLPSKPVFKSLEISRETKSVVLIE